MLPRVQTDVLWQRQTWVLPLEQNEMLLQSKQTLALLLEQAEMLPLSLEPTEVLLLEQAEMLLQNKQTELDKVQGGCSDQCHV